MSEITFRARMTVTRSFVEPMQFECDLRPVPLADMTVIRVHVEQVARHIDKEALVAVLDELLAPNGAVRFVDVTLRPAPDATALEPFR
jgi:hypothetical protein